MTYATAANVRVITSLTTDDISDDDLNTLIGHATAMVNKEISVEEIDELIDSVNAEKTNKVDGTNTTFYTKYWPIGDIDDDGDVDTSDIRVYQVNLSADPPTRTALTVATITPLLGKFTLSTAPTTGYDYYIHYRWIPKNLNLNTPPPLLKLAVMQLTAAFAFMALEPHQLKKLDTLDVVRMPMASDNFMRRYDNTMNLLKNAISESTSGGVGFADLTALQRNEAGDVL